MPLVSVVIPAYNPGPFLASAVASVAAQTLKDWDIVVVDDGSIESIEELMRPFPFVRILHQQNQGQAMARNLGITQSVGKYVAFLDQDDLWVPRKLEHQILLFKENAEMPMCHTQFDLIDENGATRCAGFGRQQNYNELLEGSGIAGASSVMIDRVMLERVGLFDSISEPAEDYDLWLRLSRIGCVGFVPSVETRYRVHGNNQTRQYRNTYRCIRSILRRHLTYAIAKGEHTTLAAAKRGMKRIKRTYAGQAIDACRKELSNKCYGGAISDLSYAALLAPSAAALAVIDTIKRRVSSSKK